ncbi:hypothetical protein BH09ACT6_BH09ACT6_05840 [soil metagenome]
MSERTVKVSLLAEVGGYVRGFEQASKKTLELASASEKMRLQGEAMGKVGTAFAAVGTLAAVGLGLSISKTSEFDKAMSSVQASTHETAGVMGLFRQAALDAGAGTVYSATEAANAIDELAKAGVSSADILGGGLKGALSLASAGSIDVADAASIAATAMTQFKVSGGDVGHVADLLAAGAGKAQGSVDDLSQALNQGGLVASQAGMSIEDTTGVLAAFASAGLLGSDAGTSMKTMLLALESPSVKAQGVMDQYGISVYDSSGKMLDFGGIAGQLKTKLGGLTDQQRNSALATIFGTDAVRAASILYDQGADGIKKWNDKVNDSGYAAEMARLKLDNLRGDIEYLQGSIDSGLIESGSAANDVLRALVQTATNAVNVFDEAPEPVQQAALAFIALGGGVSLLGGAFLMGIPKVAAFRASLETLSKTMPNVATAAKITTVSLGMVGVAMAVATSVAAVFIQRQADADARVQALTDSLDQQTGGLTDNSRALAVKALTENDAIATAKGLKVSLSLVTDAALGNKDAVAELAREQEVYNQKMSGIRESTSMGGRGFDLLQQKVGDVSGEVAQSTQKFKDNQAAMNDTAPVAVTASQAYQDAAKGASDLVSDLTRLIDTVNKANGVGQDAVSSNAAYQKSLSDAQDTVKKALAGTEGYSTSLDESTAAGSANADMLANLAGQSEKAAAAQYQVDLTTMSANDATNNYRASLDSGRQAIYDTALALTGNAEQAQALTDKVAAMPTEHAIQVALQAAQAAADADALRAKLDALPDTIDIRVRTLGDGSMLMPNLGGPANPTATDVAGGNHALGGTVGYANGGTIGSSSTAMGAIAAASLEFAQRHQGFAGGGTAIGPGTAKSDSILTRLSVGEEVIQNPFASLYRTELKQMNQGTYPRQQIDARYIQYAQPTISADSIAAAVGKVMATTRPPVVITQTVNPSQGMSETTIARLAASKLDWELGKLP